MKGTIDGQPFDYDMDSVRFDEAEAVERAMGCSFKQWGERLSDGSVAALRALVWLIRRRDQPGLRIDDVSLTSMPLSALTIEAEPEEEPDTAADPTTLAVADDAAAS